MSLVNKESDDSVLLVEEDINHRMSTIFEKFLDRGKIERKEYQVDGIKWCLRNELRRNPPFKVRGGFIADEMGLGKTIQMIGLCLTNYLQRTLIVLPPILIDQWMLQIFRTTGHKALLYHGTNKKRITLDTLSNAPIVITSYGDVSMTKKQLESKSYKLIHQIKWPRIIFDEAHHLRNKKTMLFESVRLLKADIRWLVSGTPIQNNKNDFYNLCNILRLPTSYYKEPSNLPSLCRCYILKRTKKQVGIVFADLFQDTNVVLWKNKKEQGLSEEIHSAFMFSNVIMKPYTSSDSSNLILKSVAGCGLALLTKAKQSCILPRLMQRSFDKFVSQNMISMCYSDYIEAFNYSSKLDAVIDSILKKKDNGFGKLVFCHYREEIDEISKRLINGGITKVVTFDGRTSNSRRNKILAEKNDVLILQLQTCCEGLNLQENYNEIYFICPHWNPAVEDQAVARCHRIGQNKPVYVTRFEMGGFEQPKNTDVSTMTIDRYVHDMQSTKRQVANEIIEAK